MVCDEATSALDKTVQVQIIELLQTLRREKGVALLFITHDLALVQSFADRVVVMRGGRIVEQGSTEQVFERPKDAYTSALIAARPVADPEVQEQRRRAQREQQSYPEAQVSADAVAGFARTMPVVGAG